VERKEGERGWRGRKGSYELDHVGMLIVTCQLASLQD